VLVFDHSKVKRRTRGYMTNGQRNYDGDRNTTATSVLYVIINIIFP
jgi:hypothetical protein